MIYTNRDRLAIIQLAEKRDSVTINELISVLRNNPTDTIYIESAGSLRGIIGSGRIARESIREKGEHNITFNKNYTFVRPGEYMRARQIFKGQKQFIHSLPVINEKGSLLGAYSKSDGLCHLKYLPAALFENEYARIFWQKHCRVTLVRPCTLFKKKTQLLSEWIDALTGLVNLAVIDREELSVYAEKSDIIIFVDADELRGTINLHRTLHRYDKINWHKTTTYSALPNQIENEIIEKTLKSLQSQGVHVLTAGIRENASGHLQKFNSWIREKYQKLGTRDPRELPQQIETLLPHKLEKDFFQELYSADYAEQIRSIQYSPDVHELIYSIKDVEQPGFHVRRGERVTVDQPLKYERCIYMYGPCIIMGLTVEDKHTVASLLQAKINHAGYAYKVINLGAHNASPLVEFNKIAATQFRRGDVAVWYSLYNRAPDINMTDILEKNDVPVGWVLDQVSHGNHKVHKLVANTIYNALTPVFQESLKDRNEVCHVPNIFDWYIESYFSHYDPSGHKTIGSIVMNCNPFTLGHRHLIEEALRTVDLLILFVVKEDMSLFSFEERFAMVSCGVSDLENIIVVPSGDVILSKVTFPEYFTKTADEDIVRNVENDIVMFAERVASKLNITHRFVGEELEDAVTNEYNNAMKRILPSYGIELIEIPRLKKEGQVISATTVRKCLETGDFEQLEHLIPESTKRILYLRNE